MQTTWQRVASVADLPPSGTLQVVCGGVPVCLYRIDQGVFATDDTCTHAEASLADGVIDGENIECPYHQGLFHIPTGKAVGAPCSVDLRVHPVRIEGDDVLLACEAP